MNGEAVAAFPAHALKAKRFKKRRHTFVSPWIKEKIDVYKVALGVSHKEVLDSVESRIDWAKYYNPDGHLKPGHRLPRDWFSRHPELDTTRPRVP